MQNAMWITQAPFLIYSGLSAKIMPLWSSWLRSGRVGDEVRELMRKRGRNGRLLSFFVKQISRFVAHPFLPCCFLLLYAVHIAVILPSSQRYAFFCLYSFIFLFIHSFVSTSRDAKLWAGIQKAIFYSDSLMHLLRFFPNHTNGGVRLNGRW